MLRVSTTHLESFRRVLHTEYAREEDLVASIQGKPFPAVWQMAAGTAWHALLENWQCLLAGKERHRWGDYEFYQGDIMAAARVIGPGVREVKATRVWDIGGKLVNVVAKADHVRGLGVSDIKTKFSTPDARDYEPSLQWRFYLAVHGASWFRYVLCDFRDPKDGYCDLKDIVTFKFWPYVDLEADCQRWLRLFLEWAESRKLLPYLEREGSSLTAECVA